MPKKLFKRWAPDPHKIRTNPALKFLGVLLHDPNLFHLNRHSVSVAFFVGLFIAFLPIPGHIPLAALSALLFRCNLPIAVALVWISNPLTIPFIFYAAYKVGAAILNTPVGNQSFAFTWTWLRDELPRIWQPLLLGSLLASLLFSCLGYLSIQWFWRWHIVSKWKQRRQKRRADKAHS